MRGRLALAALVVIAGLVLEVLQIQWAGPFVLGLALGLVFDRAWLALLAGAGTGLLVWGIPLLAAQLSYGIGPAAGALSAILGLDHQGTFAIAATLLVGVLLGLAGAWLGSAAREVLVARNARVDARRGE